MAEAAIIIGIHGLANKPPQAEKQQWWKQALIEGLKRNAGKTNDQLPFDFVYWADLRYPNPVPDQDNNQPYWPAPGEGPLPAYQSHKWTEMFVEASTEILNNLTEKIGAEISYLDMHTGISQIGDYVLERELTNLAAYYTDETFRNTVRIRLADKLKEYKDKRIMLIAHSMGTIIAYDVLRQLGRDDPQIRVDHFVTIGSPLGMPHVKYKLAQENDLIRTPSIVGRWTNFADRRDVVAIDAKLADDYEPNDQGIKVVDIPVLNTYRSPSNQNPPNHQNFHKSYGYLRTPELSAIVRSFV